MVFSHEDASAAAAVESLTLPEVTQTVIFTRVEGRTPMPEGESLRELAAHHSTLCIFLSITLLGKVSAELLAAGWSPDAPVVVVHKASWPGEEKIVRGTVATIQALCRDASGRLLGYALTGGAVMDKLALNKELPPLLA